ncbi:ataxin 1 [Musca autumnalis]|uniref:ataxin 1 n=1 Tax=Musca autumnalis TaxID=221902 RepID=UPI003CFA02E6
MSNDELQRLVPFNSDIAHLWNYYNARHQSATPNEDNINTYDANNNNNSLTQTIVTITSPGSDTFLHHSKSGRHLRQSFSRSDSQSSESTSIDIVDIEDCGDNSMSPVSIPATQKSLLSSEPKSTALPQHLRQSQAMELTTASVPSGFPLNYPQLYANNAALYGAPVMFSGALHAAHASYMAGLPMHAALPPNETYLKAIQAAAACGIYNPTGLPHPITPPNLMSCKSANIPSSAAQMMALAPSAPIAMPPKSPQYTNTNDIQINKSETEQHHSSTSLNATGSVRLGSTSSTNGTYLNEKVNENNSDAANDSHFKVPNGKEGSLKHRLIKPSANESSDVNKIPVMRTYTTTSNFKKGTYIELANGALRRVEDMRTEDFIQCADRSPQHQLAESTVVKINTSPQQSTAVITFSYDRNRSKVDMEVSVDHPFFVYGQGWASCNPEMSMQVFGLKCQRLQVGDICISLTKRTTEVPNSQRRHSLSSISNNPNANNNTSPVHSTAINSTADLPYSPHLNAHQYPMTAPPNLPHPLPAYAEMAKLMSSYAYAKGLPQISPEQLKEVVMDATMLQNLSPKMINAAFYQNQIYQLAQQQQELLRQNEIKYSQERTPPQGLEIDQHNQPTSHTCPSQTHPLDASMSRKRRWSAPENMFDDEDAETQPPRNHHLPSSSNTLSPATIART